jgi:5-methyltetrahydrofolate--homocysteine methyltransferase
MLGGAPAGNRAHQQLRDASDLRRVGFLFGHRDSEYFGVARIGRDQLEDYAARRGVSTLEAERWLRPNLDG